MLLAWPCIFLEKEGYWIWTLITSSIQSHINPTITSLETTWYYNRLWLCSDFRPGNNGGYMDDHGYGSSRIWNISPGVTLYDVVISGYYWDFLQAVLYTVPDFWYVCMYKTFGPNWVSIWCLKIQLSFNYIWCLQNQKSGIVEALV